MELSPARRDGVMEAMKRYSSMVYRLAYARTRNHADAEDIYQEVFLKLARADISLEDQEHVKAWLLRVTVNCSVNLFRSAWRRHVQTVEALPERASPLIDNDRYEALNGALDSLPARYRAVIHLYYYSQRGMVFAMPLFNAWLSFLPLDIYRYSIYNHYIDNLYKGVRYHAY